MASGERTNPPFYDELFAGFAGMAAARGAINYDPLDRALEPGNDGSLTAAGERAYAYEYALNADELPKSIRDMGIDRIEVESHTTRVYDDSIWPERVSMLIRRDIGITTMLGIEREAGAVSMYRDLSVHDDSRDVADFIVGKGLSDQERDEILMDVLNHRHHWLDQDGPAGEYARAAYVHLNTPDSVDAEDIDMLRKILEELGKTNQK